MASLEHVRVMYDYDYINTEGNKVSIRVGEEYIVLKKTSLEWWYVLKRTSTKEGKPSKESFYVPANYVETIHKTVIEVAPPPIPAKSKKPPMRPPKPKTRLPKPLDADEVLKELDDMLESAYETLPFFTQNGKESTQSSELTVQQSASASVSSAEDISETKSSDSNQVDNVKTDTNSNIELPDYANLEEIRASILENEAHGREVESAPKTVSYQYIYMYMISCYH